MSVLSNTVESILADCRAIAECGQDAATARANVRDSVKGLFPDKPTEAQISEITGSDDWKRLTDGAREIFAKAYFTAPREIEREIVHLDAEQVSLWKATKKAAKDFTPAEMRIRKAAQGYVRTAVKQNITAFIPDAVDAKVVDTVEDLPNPKKLFDAFIEGHITLSEKAPDAARTLLNAMSEWVKYARPFIAEGKPIPREVGKA